MLYSSSSFTYFNIFLSPSFLIVFSCYTTPKPKLVVLTPSVTSLIVYMVLLCHTIHFSPFTDLVLRPCFVYMHNYTAVRVHVDVVLRARARVFIGSRTSWSSQLELMQCNAVDLAMK